MSTVGSRFSNVTDLYSVVTHTLRQLMAPKNGEAEIMLTDTEIWTRMFVYNRREHPLVQALTLESIK